MIQSPENVHGMALHKFTSLSPFNQKFCMKPCSHGPEASWSQTASHMLFSKQFGLLFCTFSGIEGYSKLMVTNIASYPVPSLRHSPCIRYIMPQTIYMCNGNLSAKILSSRYKVGVSQWISILSLFSVPFSLQMDLGTEGGREHLFLTNSLTWT